MIQLWVKNIGRKRGRSRHFLLPREWYHFHSEYMVTSPFSSLSPYHFQSNSVVASCCSCLRLCLILCFPYLLLPSPFFPSSLFMILILYLLCSPVLLPLLSSFSWILSFWMQKGKHLCRCIYVFYFFGFKFELLTWYIIIRSNCNQSSFSCKDKDGDRRIASKKKKGEGIQTKSCTIFSVVTNDRIGAFCCKINCHFNLISFDLVRFVLIWFGLIECAASLVKTKLGLYPLNSLENDVMNVDLRVSFFFSCFLLKEDNR